MKPADTTTSDGGVEQSEQNMALVPGKAHYGLDYLAGGRVFSYAHQIEAVRRLEADSVIEIGPGPGLVTTTLRAIGVKVTTVDVQAALEPDVIASVLKLPFESDSFDVAMCCQVLEHLHFDHFTTALKELSRVARRGVILSLPDASPYYIVHARLPRIRCLRWVGTRHRDPGEEWKRDQLDRNGHYWEIGYHDTRCRRVIQCITHAGLSVDSTWRVPEKVYHRFFVLRDGDHNPNASPG